MKKILYLIIAITSTSFSFTTLNQDTLASWLKNGAPFDFVLIDIRGPQEITRVIGTVSCKPYNLVWDTQFKELAVKLGKEQHILIYCRSGNRSVAASSYLDNAEFKNVYNAGGFTSWESNYKDLTVPYSDTLSNSKLPEPSMKKITFTLHNNTRSSGMKIMQPIGSVGFSNNPMAIRSKYTFNICGQYQSSVTKKYRAAGYFIYYNKK
jgi:rhodanese-related sulfurtransferase